MTCSAPPREPPVEQIEFLVALESGSAGIGDRIKGWFSKTLALNVKAIFNKHASRFRFQITATFSLDLNRRQSVVSWSDLCRERATATGVYEGARNGSAAPPANSSTR